MKLNKNIKVGILALTLTACIPLGCKNVLEQEYRAGLGPEYFSTAEGLQAGLNASYAITRYFWGSEGFTTSCVGGTDEVLRSGDGDLILQTYAGLTAQDGSIASIWNNSYVPINNLNGILKYGPDANIPEPRKTQMLGEAKFLRAFFYYLLVTSFGDVPLRTEFNTTPTTTAKRAPKKDVYNAIIKDLTEASAQLPMVTPSNSPSKGRAYRAAAFLLLAKAHLAKGWDPDARDGDGTADFNKAYEVANTLIANKASYGVDLEQNFADVFRDGNEYGKEALFVADRNTDPTYSESAFNNGTTPDGNKENRLNHYWVSFYTLARNVNANIPGAPTSSQTLMNRDVNNGRPYRRFRPSPYTYAAFDNRSSDSRYDGTFQKAWIANTPSTASSIYQSTITTPITTSRNGVTLTLAANVDTAIYMPGREVTVEERQKFKGVIIAPSQYDVEWFPTMTKHADITRQHYNDPSDRPIILMRLGEAYLIAAEAAFKAGRPGDAATVLNTLRKRAAFRAKNTSAQNDAATAALNVTAGDINLEFILRERTREMYGEMTRWYDLVRTRTLVERVKLYNELAAPNIKDFHVLRPIPTGSQLDLITNKNEFPQNPGY
jgi:hypothetical protein